MTWSIKFPKLPSDPSQVPDTAIEYAEFCFRKIKTEPDAVDIEDAVPYYEVHAWQFQSSFLRHKHTGDDIIAFDLTPSLNASSSKFHGLIDLRF